MANTTNPLYPVPVSIQVTANGTDVSSSVDWTSIEMTLVLTKEVSTFEFNVKGNAGVPGKYVAQINDVINVIENYTISGSLVSTVVFGGTVTEIERVNVSAGSQGGILLTDQVTATDWSFQMNAKLVTSSFSNMDPADIVAAIVPAGYNATTFVQRAGYDISSIKFNYEQVTKCLQALATQIGWQWYIDANKYVHFFLAENNAAPVVIDDTSGWGEYNTLDVDVNLVNMKNSVFVVGGTYESILTISTTPDNYLGNGTQQGFGLVYSYIASTIAVLLNSVGQSVGILNQETNPAAFDVLYDPAGKTITFNTPPPNGQLIQVFGTAEIPIVGHAQDSALISLYGEYQDAIFDANILSIQEAQERAQADILQFGNPVYDVKFSTLVPGILIGQNITLNSSLYGVSNYPLVVKRVYAVGYGPNNLEYQCEAIGSDVVTFVDIMSTLLTQENSQPGQADNTTLESLISVTENGLVLADSVSVSHTSGPYLVGSTAITGFCTCA